jgi:hypothetical protein
MSDLIDVFLIYDFIGDPVKFYLLSLTPAQLSMVEKCHGLYLNCDDEYYDDLILLETFLSFKEPLEYKQHNPFLIENNGKLKIIHTGYAP